MSGVLTDNGGAFDPDLSIGSGALIAGSQPPPGNTGALPAAGLPQAAPTQGALPAAASPKARQIATIAQTKNRLAARNTLIASGAANPNSPTINAIDQSIGQPAGAPPMQGALTAQPPPQMQYRSFNPPMPQDPGFNVPMMAMAGAMLQPTRTGGFAESLGNALSVGAQETQRQREMLENEALRQQQQEDNRIWRMGQLANTAQRNDFYGQGIQNRHEDNQDRIAEQSAAANARIAAAMEKNAAGKYTYQAATQPDPNDPTKTVSGFVRLPVTGDEAPQFIPLNTTTASQQNASTNAGRTKSIAEWRSELAARATTKAKQDSIKEMTDEQIRLLIAAQNAGTPITSDAVRDTVNKLRANAGAASPVPGVSVSAAPSIAPSAPTAPANPTFPQAPAAAIQILKNDPSALPYFVKRWGNDQARAALGQ